MTFARPIGLTLLAVMFLATASSAELATWNQDRVTKLGQEVREKTSSLYDTFYKHPTPTIGSSQARSYYSLKQQVRRIKREAKHLADRLDGGEGYEETLPIYKNLQREVNSATEESRRTFTSEELLAAATSAGDALRRIAPYYDPEVLRNPVEEAEEASAD